VLLSGFVARIDPPGPVGRLRYLRALEGAPSRNGRAAAIEQLARDASGSYLDLRNALLRSRDERPAKYLELIDPARTFARVRDRVCARLGVNADELIGKSQGRQLSLARKVLAYLCVQESLSRAEVGRYLGQRTRAAVSYMTKSLVADMARRPEVRALVEELL
jgi:chromosomal replication initiation ATPase DnaA